MRFRITIRLRARRQALLSDKPQHISNSLCNIDNQCLAGTFADAPSYPAAPPIRSRNPDKQYHRQHNEYISHHRNAASCLHGKYSDPSEHYSRVRNHAAQRLCLITKRPEYPSGTESAWSPLRATRNSGISPHHNPAEKYASAGSTACGIFLLQRFANNTFHMFKIQEVAQSE